MSLFLCDVNFTWLEAQSITLHFSNQPTRIINTGWQLLSNFHLLICIHSDFQFFCLFYNKMFIWLSDFNLFLRYLSFYLIFICSWNVYLFKRYLFVQEIFICSWDVSLFINVYLFIYLFIRCVHEMIISTWDVYLFMKYLSVHEMFICSQNIHLFMRCLLFHEMRTILSA